MDVILSLAPEKLLGCEEELNENVCVKVAGRC